MSTTAWASVSDRGVLNTRLSEPLSAVWIDRDLSWLDFNERVLAEALDERPLARTGESPRNLYLQPRRVKVPGGLTQ
jgi:hypothetical protein